MFSTSPSSVASFDGASDTDVAWILSSPSPRGSVASEPLSRVSTPGLREPTKHPRFYYKDGSLSFWLEDVVFRVHGSIFTSLSPFWARRFGSVETLNVLMQDEFDISGFELSSFLSVLYPKSFCKPDIKTVAEWTAALRLASMWSFEGIRELAIQQLDGRLPPLERLVLSRTYDIPTWLPDAFVDMILREDSLTIDEMKRLETNIQDIAHITTGREALLCKKVLANARSVRAYVLKDIIQTPTVPTPNSVPPPVPSPSEASKKTVDPPEARTIMSKQSLSIKNTDDTSTDTNTQLTLEESQALKTALTNYDYDTAIRYARADTTPVFCEAIALAVDDLDWLSNYEKLTFATVRLVVVDASSLQRAVQILKFLAVIAEPKKSLSRKYKALLKATVEELRETWTHTDFGGFTTDESVKRLTTFDGHTKAFRVMGPRDFLVAFPSVYIQRSLNLKPFVAALVKAKLVE